MVARKAQKFLGESWWCGEVLNYLKMLIILMEFLFCALFDRVKGI
jgi:hypothetical protein